MMSQSLTTITIVPRDWSSVHRGERPYARPLRANYASMDPRSHWCLVVIGRPRTRMRADGSSKLLIPSTSCGRGVGQGITPGASSWVTLRLAPSNYELLCDELGHYANGMFTSFTVC